MPTRAFRAVAALIATAGALVTAAPAQAASNGPDQSDFACRQVADGTVCDGSWIFEVPPGPSDLVCGDGAGAFTVWDQGIAHSRLTIWLDHSDAITRLVSDDRWTSAMWSNPLTGKTLPYTQQGVSTVDWGVAGDDATATVTVRGEVVFTDPATHQMVQTNVGRVVFSLTTGELLASAGKQPLFAPDRAAALEAACGALT